ncbi:MAG TPA: hypothetical protein VM431_01515, partial [Phycisphaerae bacterium]|nr:hypothetical protein [Phycisphaerae bacterium]
MAAAIAVSIVAAAQAAPSPDERTEIVFWNLFTTGDQQRVIADLVDRFNAGQSAYRVKKVDIPYQHIHSKMLPAVAGNVPPDVSIFDRFLVASFAGRG